MHYYAKILISIESQNTCLIVLKHYRCLYNYIQCGTALKTLLISIKLQNMSLILCVSVHTKTHFKHQNLTVVGLANIPEYDSKPLHLYLTMDCL